MEAILYVCHGSRVKEAASQAVSFIKKCIAKHPAPVQEYCFLELAEPSIEVAFARCVERGAKKIAVVPVLLLTAAHAKKDIPEEVLKAASRYPETEVRYARPIGVHPYMIDVLLEKTFKPGAELTGNTEVLLVGRGSSDPDAKKDLQLIAALLEGRLDGASVKTCFLTAAEPAFEAALHESATGSADKVLVIPYLLFTGILMKHIEAVIHEHIAAGRFVILCEYLGYHHYIEEILIDRANEALNDPGCILG